MYRKFSFILFIIYILGMTAFMIWQGIGIAPDRYAFILLLGSLFIKRTRQFILDWSPFLFILLSYDFLRGFADKLGMRVHYTEMINFDRWLFRGTDPTLWLQHTFYQTGSLHWYDFLGTILYFLHFALPLGFAYLLWLKNRSRFKEFVIAILLLSYAGWVTYVVYPAAPPWLASQEEYLPGVVKIMDATLGAFPEKLSLPTVYHNFEPNPVAAVPSMHAAYPFLVLLFCLSYFGARGLFFTPYVLAVWLAVVYLGEHYVFDVILGAVYAGVFFFLTKLAWAKKDWKEKVSHLLTWKKPSQ